MKRSLKFGIGGLIVLALAAVPLVRAADKTIATGAAAPGFSLVDQNGKTVNLSDYPGKIIVLEWTNPQCPVVQRHYQAKTMSTLYGQYKDKVVWIAINSTAAQTNRDNLAWAGEQGIAYPILNDAAGTVGHAYGAKTTPHMFVIDKGGKIAYAGGIDNDPQGDKSDRINYVKQALDEMLAGKPVSVAASKSYGCAVHYAR